MRQIHLPNMERDGGEVVIIIIVLVEFLADALKHLLLKIVKKKKN